MLPFYSRRSSFLLPLTRMYANRRTNLQWVTEQIFGEKGPQYRDNLGENNVKVNEEKLQMEDETRQHVRRREMLDNMGPQDDLSLGVSEEFDRSSSNNEREVVADMKQQVQKAEDRRDS